MKGLREHVAAVVAPLARSMRLMLGRAVINLIDDTTGLQTVQVQMLNDEVVNGAEHFHPYGLTSNPLPGAEGIGASIGGARSHQVILVVDDRRYRLKSLAGGEVAVYDNQGQYVWLKQNGIVEVNAITKLNVIAPDAEFSGNVKIDGTLETVGNATFDAAVNVTGNIAGAAAVSDATGTMQKMRDQYNASSAPPPEMD